MVCQQPAIGKMSPVGHLLMLIISKESLLWPPRQAV